MISAQKGKCCFRASHQLHVCWRSTQKGGVHGRRQVPPTGAVISIRSLHKSPSSTSALKAEKSSLQVGKGNYSQMSISQGNLERLPSYHPPRPGGAAQKSLCPPTNATAKHSRLRLRQEVPNSVAGALLWSRERAGGGPSSRLTRACPFLQAYTPVNSES